MASRFRRGAYVYAKDGRSYIVEEVAGGVVYCTSPGGAETEFPESALMNEAEWAARSHGRGDVSYARLRQSRAYAEPAGKLDPAASERLLAKVERLSPGLLDFAAYTVAARIMAEHGDADLVPELSTAKCREIFQAAKPETRASLLAGVLGARAEALVDAGRLGDNLMRAMLEKGLESQAAAYESFRKRGRR